MRYAKTFSMIFCLIVGIFVLGGCKDGNYSFERSSTVEVSSDSGINYSSKYSETRSTGGLFAYKVDDANLFDGQTEIYVSITNNGARDTTMKAMTITFKATDEKNNIIREGGCKFDQLSIKLPQNVEVHEKFVIQDQSWKKYDGTFTINCDFTDITVDPDV